MSIFVRILKKVSTHGHAGHLSRVDFADSSLPHILLNGELSAPAKSSPLPGITEKDPEDVYNQPFVGFIKLSSSVTAV
jgi:hypothetical protein